MSDQGPALMGGVLQGAMDQEGVVMTHVGCRDNKQCTGKYRRKELTEMLRCHMLAADITDNLQVSNREK